MKAFVFLVMLVGSVMAASQEKGVKSRQFSFGQEQVLVQSAPQFGARLSSAYLQGYQQPQYVPAGQQIAYISGAPSQAYYSGAVAPTHYSGASQFSQPLAVKKIVKPAVYQAAAPQVAYQQPLVSAFHAHAPATYKARQPVHAAAFKTVAAPVAAPAYKFAAAPIAAAAPAPALLKASVPHDATPAQYSAQPNYAIISYSQDDNFDGSFNYNYETDHGIAVQSAGYVKNAGTEDAIQVMQGSYTYYSPEGVPITTTYIADENGFQVQGDHLPVAPPLPEAIAKSIEYQRSLPPSAEEQTLAARQ